jgi:hypothetical protein
MKTNREMTENVLNKASQIAAHKKLVRKRAAGILTGTLCLVLILGLVLAPLNGQQNPIFTQGQISEPPAEGDQGNVTVRTGKVYFLSNPNGADTLSPLKADTTYAVSQMIRVFPKESKDAAEAFYNAWLSKYTAISDEWSRAVYDSEEAIIYSLSAGVTSLILPDHTQISDFEMESTGVLVSGKTHAQFHKDHTIRTGEHTVTIPAGSYRVYLRFYPSDETVKLLEDDPKTPLSTIRDTYTLTIHYKNGTSEVLKFDVYLDDEGQVYTSLCRSSTV